MAPKNTEPSKPGTLRIRWVRSTIGCPQKQRAVVRGLGFRKLQQVVERPDSAAIRGMVARVRHLVKIEE
ncbi:MAG: 50S ribosomal protein L30 [Acidobacteria bacterium]|nr:50S ribosomal protein L30 [Acidobacteriota bacterium]